MYAREYREEKYVVCRVNLKAKRFTTLIMLYGGACEIQGYYVCYYDED